MGTYRYSEQLESTGRLHLLWQMNLAIEMPGVRVLYGARFLPDNLTNDNFLLSGTFHIIVSSLSSNLTGMLRGGHATVGQRIGRPLVLNTAGETDDDFLRFR